MTINHGDGASASALVRFGSPHTSCAKTSANNRCHRHCQGRDAHRLYLPLRELSSSFAPGASTKDALRTLLDARQDLIHHIGKHSLPNVPRNGCQPTISFFYFEEVSRAGLEPATLSLKVR